MHDIGKAGSKIEGLGIHPVFGKGLPILYKLHVHAYFFSFSLYAPDSPFGMESEVHSLSRIQRPR